MMLLNGGRVRGTLRPQQMVGTRPPSTLVEDIQAQLALMGARAPAYGAVLRTLADLLLGADGTDLRERFDRAWSKRTFGVYYERPLLLLATLRYDALVEGQGHPLFEAIAADDPDPATVTADRLARALTADRLGFWMTLRNRRVQTNEPRRSVVWLWPAALAGCASRRRPVALIDVGASAGLNLAADGFSHAWQASDGGDIPVAREIDAKSRHGFDMRPLDVHKPEDRRWLEACVWPGEHARLSQLRQAIDAFTRAIPPAKVTIATASAVPERLAPFSRIVREGGLVIVYQSMLSGYLASHEQATYERGMDRWLSSSAPCSALWVTLEIGSSQDAEIGTLVEARFHDGSALRMLELARTGYHPETLHVDRAAERELASCFAS